MKKSGKAMDDEPTVELFEPDLKWFGQRARRLPGLTLTNVVDYLPVFKRRDFGDNEYLDLSTGISYRSSAMDYAL